MTPELLSDRGCMLSEQETSCSVKHSRSFISLHCSPAFRLASGAGRASIIHKHGISLWYICVLICFIRRLFLLFTRCLCFNVNQGCDSPAMLYNKSEKKRRAYAFQQSEGEPLKAAAWSCTTNKHMLKMSMGLLGVKFPKTKLVLSLTTWVTQADFRFCATNKKNCCTSTCRFAFG